MLYLNLLTLLVIGHYAADYLQSSFTAAMKAPNACIGWLHILLGHTAIQAATVIAAMTYCGFNQTTAVAFGALEMTLHSIIDMQKSQNRIGFHTDQIAHIGCKVAYVAFLLIPQVSWLRIGIIAGIAIFPICAAIVIAATARGAFYEKSQRQ